MPWDPFDPVPPSPDRQAIPRPIATPFGVAFDNIGPGAGVGTGAEATASTPASAPASAPAHVPTGRVMRELERIPPIDNVEAVYFAAFEPGFATLLVYNPLAAVLHLYWGTGDTKPIADPTDGAYPSADVAVPGNAYAALPIPSAATGVAAVLVYLAAQPGTDLFYNGVLSVTTDVLPAFVGPLA